MNQNVMGHSLSNELIMFLTSKTSDCCVSPIMHCFLSQSQQPGSQNSQNPVNQKQAVHPPSFGVIEGSSPVSIETASTAS